MIKSLREARIVDGVPRIVAGQDWVQALSEALGVPTENILGVGDGDSDVKWALNSGFVSVAVTWGYRTREQLTEAGAHLAASSCTVSSGR